MLGNLAHIGRAIGSPARAAMIYALFDGEPHSAGQLAGAAGVSSATASQHLAILSEAGVVTVRRQGRYRHYQLANSRIAHALEQLSEPGLPTVTSLRLSREQRRVRLARTCYDHLAGQLGVALAQRMVAIEWITPPMSAVTPEGTKALADHFGLDVEASARSRRPTIRPCRDWTEQRDHIAGTLGAMIATTLLDDAWVIRRPSSRALTITEHGAERLHAAGVDLVVGRDAQT
ncbi:ArsR/SmtB family transcription factor [Nocardioides jensenii]|uniref:ArsR/SmtB family transcription factor n=1 Tax=Nocardioides jensenii TaxID=1843 RepID=UPI0008319170|nr:metalloregulator ArsR/SmtB family transcription factor [Nocardioides jensenii]